MNEPVCTCWRFPTTDGQVLPLRAASLQHDVQITLHSGEVVQGWSYGAETVTLPQGSTTLVVEVEPQDGSDVIALRPEQIATVTPVGGHTERESFLDALSALIDHVRVGKPTEHMHLVAADHETIEVTVTRRGHSCSPPS
ncbi:MULTISPECIES: hypothetical protein [unclassified Nocardioides]|uniref:hypothetical protein n=1 Tax=unclassified Nocardioides TaxID=2615069 RepID=UPI0030154A8D